MTTDTVLSIWERAIPGGDGLPPDAAREFLRISLAAEDRSRAAELSVRAADGTLTAEERAELEAFTHAAALLTVLHSKARVALRSGGGHGVPAA
jgi:hypothetical protein